jgi:hypothetical protein
VTKYNVDREQWLTSAVNQIIELVFKPHDLRQPPILRVACGILPSKWAGACSNPEYADDAAVHIWISPKLGTGDEMEILGTLVHELVHAHCFAEGYTEHKHGAPFSSVIRTVGLEGKPAQATAYEGTELWSTLQGVAASLGEYPHRPLRGKPKKTRQTETLAYVSETDPEFEVKVKFSVAYEKGVPKDFNGQPMVPKDKDKWTELEEAYLNKVEEEKNSDAAPEADTVSEEEAAQ